MKENKILAAWQQLPSPQVTVAMASLGFDWIVLDLEHASTTIQEAEAIFIAAELHKSKPFTRLPSHDPYLARRLLDAGAVGLIVPAVESKEEFDTFAKHCYFPPKGKRGLGLVRANLWGQSLNTYFHTFSPLLIGQIETGKGVSNIEEILSSPYLDGIMIGPYDLSASLGHVGEFEEQKFKQNCQQINSLAKLHGKMVGYHQVDTQVDLLQQRLNEDYDFIAYGTDLVAIMHALKGIKQ